MRWEKLFILLGALFLISFTSAYVCDDTNRVSINDLPCEIITPVNLTCSSNVTTLYQNDSILGSLQMYLKYPSNNTYNFSFSDNRLGNHWFGLCDGTSAIIEVYDNQNCSAGYFSGGYSPNGTIICLAESDPLWTANYSLFLQMNQSISNLSQSINSMNNSINSLNSSLNSSLTSLWNSISLIYTNLTLVWANISENNISIYSINQSINNLNLQLSQLNNSVFYLNISVSNLTATVFPAIPLITGGGGNTNIGELNLNRTKIICEEVYYFSLLHQDNQGNLNYSKSELDDLSSKLSGKLGVPFSDDYIKYYLENYNQCYSYTSLRFPSNQDKYLTVSSNELNQSLTTVFSCDLSNKFSVLDIAIPIPNIVLPNYDCSRAKSFKLWAKYEMQDSQVTLTGIRFWWIVLVVIVLVVIIFRAKPKKQKPNATKKYFSEDLNNNLEYDPYRENN